MSIREDAQCHMPFGKRKSERRLGAAHLSERAKTHSTGNSRGRRGCGTGSPRSALAGVRHGAAALKGGSTVSHKTENALTARLSHHTPRHLPKGAKTHVRTQRERGGLYQLHPHSPQLGSSHGAFPRRWVSTLWSTRTMG